MTGRTTKIAERQLFGFPTGRNQQILLKNSVASPRQGFAIMNA